MSRQILKNLTMLTLVVGLALAAAMVPAKGQTSIPLKADIPFDFIVGDQTLPAGKYMVTSATSTGDGVRISSRDRKSSVMRLSQSISEKSDKANARLVFHRYGQQYFLAQIWSGDSYGRQVLQSKKERNLRNELASNGPKNNSAQASYQIIEVAIVR